MPNQANVETKAGSLGQIYARFKITKRQAKSKYTGL